MFGKNTGLSLIMTGIKPKVNRESVDGPETTNRLQRTSVHEDQLQRLQLPASSATV